MPNESSVSITPPIVCKLRAPEAARYLGLSPATLAKYRSLGGGPVFTRLGRAVVYDREDLDVWCDGFGKRRSTADSGAGGA